MGKSKSIKKEITSLSFHNREQLFQHHSYGNELLPFIYLREGKEEALAELKKNRNQNMVGTLSEDPLRNAKYLFVALTTMTTRYAIEGGLPEEDSYKISDVFIQKADKSTSINEVIQLRIEMFTYFLRSIQAQKKRRMYSKPIVTCIAYIDTHLHEPMSLAVLAEQTSLSSSYLSALFKKECQCTISTYITNKKIETAKDLLCFSEYSISDLSSYLAFSSESHFIYTFRKVVGITPKTFREQYYNNTL